MTPTDGARDQGADMFVTRLDMERFYATLREALENSRIGVDPLDYRGIGAVVEIKVYGDVRLDDLRALRDVLTTMIEAPTPEAHDDGAA